MVTHMKDIIHQLLVESFTDVADTCTNCSSEPARVLHNRAICVVVDYLKDHRQLFTHATLLFWFHKSLIWRLDRICVASESSSSSCGQNVCCESMHAHNIQSQQIVWMQMILNAPKQPYIHLDSAIKGDMLVLQSSSRKYRPWHT